MRTHKTFKARGINSENRLIHKQQLDPASEMYKQQAVNVLRNKTSTDDQLNRLRDVMEKNQSVDLLAALREEMESMTPEQQEQVRSNLARLKENAKTNAKNADEEKLEALEQALSVTPNKHSDSPAEAGGTNSQETSIESSLEQPSFLQGVGNVAETVAEHIMPKSWSEKLSSRQKVAAGVIATAGAGVLLWQLGKRLFGSAKAGNEAGHKAKGGFFKKMLIGTGIGLATFFGIKYFIKKFEKEINDAKDEMSKHLPSGETIKAAADVAETTSGIGAGIVATSTESVAKQADALQHIPQAAYELLAEGNFEKMLEHGWVFTKKEGQWIFSTATETFTVPAETFAKWYNGDLKANFEGGWIYGETGAAYVLGKATINALLTGKIRAPLSIRSLAMTGTRMAAWPLMILGDGLKTSRLLLDADGRIIAKGAVMRWGPAGMYRDWRTGKHIAQGTMEGLENGLRYFQQQNILLGAMEREVDGLGKGLVRQESINAMKKSVERMATELGKMANKMEANLLGKNLEIPNWIQKLAQAGRLSKADKITSTVDDAGDLLKAMATKEGSLDLTKGAASADEVMDIAKGADTIAEQSHLSKAMSKILDQIAELKKLGQNEQILNLLKNPLIEQAANAGNKLAQSLLKVLPVVAKYGLIVLGPILDTLFMHWNAQAIEEAKKEGNAGLVQTLEQKQLSLSLYRGSGLGLLLATGPQAAATLPFYIASSMYSDAIYNGIITWEKEGRQWLKESPADLMKELKKRKPHYTDTAARTAYGQSTFGYVWNRLPFVGKSNEELDRKGDEQFAAIEQVNAQVRQEILTAIFLQRIQAFRYPEETDEAFISRTKQAIQDRLNYIDTMTSGSYDMSNTTERMLSMAESYADLASMRRQLQKGNEELKIRYNYNGTQKELDLNSLSYVQGKKDGDRNLRKEFFGTVTQYEKELQWQRQAVSDFAAELSSL